MSHVRRTGREHVLKTWPGPFQAIVDGLKTYEIRYDDRGFAVGDRLRLVEWDPAPDWPLKSPKGETGREMRCTVRYMTPGGSWGLPPTICVLSIGDLEATEPGSAAPERNDAK